MAATPAVTAPPATPATPAYIHQFRNAWAAYTRNTHHVRPFGFDGAIGALCMTYDGVKQVALTADNRLHFGTDGVVDHVEDLASGAFAHRWEDIVEGTKDGDERRVKDAVDWKVRKLHRFLNDD